ncbi:class I SAM-dependent methyltransferase [Streptomyces sp. NPDC088846]|uniref:class I SAM-dependent methyltransferase n=1 Tax=Streptomyces sp. NPDC088846 TaxID=3365908 RepID=UPI00381834C6
MDAAEAEALREQLGTGRDRLALDLGCGAGELTRSLVRLGYRTTGIDCAPSAVATARATNPDLEIQLFDFEAGDLSQLPHSAFAAITCRLVYRWIDDKPAFLSRIRGLLAPGGTLWVVTSVHDPAQGPPGLWDTPAADIELLTTGWSSAHVSKLDPSFHCYALRP